MHDAGGGLHSENGSVILGGRSQKRATGNRDGEMTDRRLTFSRVQQLDYGCRRVVISHDGDPLPIEIRNAGSEFWYCRPDTDIVTEAQAADFDALECEMLEPLQAEIQKIVNGLSAADWQKFKADEEVKRC